MKISECLADKRLDAALIDGLKAQVSLADVISRAGISLRRTGQSRFVGCCPFHSEKTPSFTVWDGGSRPHFNCFGCGAHGDVIDFLRQSERLTFPQAADKLRSLAGEGGRAPIDPRQRQAAEAKESERSAFNRKVALEIWRQSVPARGTPVEVYLRSRGIALPPPPSLRFHPALPHPIGVTCPGMVAAVVNVKGETVAIHRTYLRADGGAKADIPGETKLALGPLAGGAVRLAQPTAAQWLIVGEGIESTLSAMQLMKLPGWAALSTSGLRGLALPPEITWMVIAADNDINGAGEAAAIAVADRWVAEGRRVKRSKPTEPGSDFNDLLRRGTAAVEIPTGGKHVSA